MSVTVLKRKSFSLTMQMTQRSMKTGWNCRPKAVCWWRMRNNQTEWRAKSERLKLFYQLTRKLTKNIHWSFDLLYCFLSYVISLHFFIIKIVLLRVNMFDCLKDAIENYPCQRMVTFRFVPMKLHTPPHPLESCHFSSLHQINTHAFLLFIPHHHFPLTPRQCPLHPAPKCWPFLRANLAPQEPSFWSRKADQSPSRPHHSATYQPIRQCEWSHAFQSCP